MEHLYSTIFIVDTSLNPDEAETVTSRIQQLVEDHGGIIRKIDRWGKKRLSFSIDNKSHGFYVEIEFTANSRLNIPKILEGEYRLNDRVLRYLTYIITKKELIQREKTSGKMRAREEAESRAAAARSAGEEEKEKKPETEKVEEPEAEKVEEPETPETEQVTEEEKAEATAAEKEPEEETAAAEVSSEKEETAEESEEENDSEEEKKQ